MVLVVKNLPVSAGEVRDAGVILGSGRSPGEGNGNPLQDSCLRIPWTEEPGRLQSMGSQRVRHNWSEKMNFFWAHKKFEKMNKMCSWSFKKIETIDSQTHQEEKERIKKIAWEMKKEELHLTPQKCKGSEKITDTTNNYILVK